MGQITIQKDVDGFKGLCVIEPKFHGDSRGYFIETYSARDMAEAGIDTVFVQDNQSMGTKGVLRGLHFQKLHPQTKLVRAIKGTVFDVVVDLRKGSATFGKWHGEVLSEENRKQFLVPKGFAHGYMVLTDMAEFCYKCDDFYYPEDEGGIQWNDPDIGIIWPGLSGEYPGNGSSDGYTVEGVPLKLVERDQKWAALKDSFLF